MPWILLLLIFISGGPFALLGCLYVAYMFGNMFMYIFGFLFWCFVGVLAWKILKTLGLALLGKIKITFKPRQKMRYTNHRTRIRKRKLNYRPRRVIPGEDYHLRYIQRYKR